MINFFLEALGIGWLILTRMVISFGGSIEIKIKNPITKETDIVTDIKIDRKNVNNK